MLTPAIYRTRITHLRRAPVHHYFEQRGYCWYVVLDGHRKVIARFESRKGPQPAR
jgi:DUF1365 family protein